MIEGVVAPMITTCGVEEDDELDVLEVDPVAASTNSPTTAAATTNAAANPGLADPSRREGLAGVPGLATKGRRSSSLIKL